MKAELFHAPRASMSVGPEDRELPPLTAYDEISGGKRNGAGRGEVAESAPRIFTTHRLSEIQAVTSQTVVQGLGFDEGAVAAIVGTPNAGKTAFAISLALAIATRAERWLGLKIAGGPVLYFGAEAYASVVMRAQAAARRLANPNPAIYLCAEAPGLGGEESGAVDAEAIIATANKIASEEGEAIKLICIDTLSACLADGDENGEGMLRLVAGAKRIATATHGLVLLIHHPSKGDSGGLRGHGSLAAVCDSILRIDTESSVTGVRTATLVKARDAATGLQLRFELEEVILENRDSFGDPRSTVVVRASTQSAPRRRPTGPCQNQLLGELERRFRTGERLWDEATLRRIGRELGMKRNSPAGALKGLRQGGFLVESSNGDALRYPPEDTL